MQGYQNYEIVISDDSPDDSVKDLLLDYDFGNKIEYIKNEISLGSPKNWNNAIGHGSGEYIKIMHHDDWFTDPSSLQKFVEALDQNPEFDFAFCNSKVEVSSAGETQKWIHSISSDQVLKINNNPNVLFFGNSIGAPSATMYRRSVNMQYDEKLKWLVDAEFYIRVLNKYKAIHIDQPLVLTYGDDHNITNDCKDNPSVELYESFYVFNKLDHKVNDHNKYIKYLLSLCNKYEIQSFGGLNNFVPKVLIPWKVTFNLMLKQLKLPGDFFFQ